jgi:FlaA1/EpsC-like NDP-sugar epimerase
MKLAKNLVIDVALIALATLLAVVVRFNFEFTGQSVQTTLPYLAFTLLSAVAMLPASGMTRILWRFAGLKEYGRIVVASGLIVAAALGMAFIHDRLDSVPRSLPPLQVMWMIALLTLRRLVERGHRFRHTARNGASPATAEPVIIVGLTSIAALFVELVHSHSSGNVVVLGVVGDQPAGMESFAGQRILGPVTNIETILAEQAALGKTARRVVVAVPLAQLASGTREVLERIESSGTAIVDCFADKVGFGDRPPDMSEVVR